MANNAYGGVPRHDDNINKLEGVSIHDAIPRQYFMQTWAKVFVRLLGTKTQDGFTFLQVYNMSDMGGVNWVGGALNADQQRQHVQRKARLLAMLKGVIDYTSIIMQSWTILQAKALRLASGTLMRCICLLQHTS